MAKSRRHIDPDEAISYRTPMRVVSVMRFDYFTETFFYPVCPRCHITMEREYQAFCDRCGQALSWANFSKAKVID